MDALITITNTKIVIILTRGENPSPPTEPSDLPFQPQFPQLNFDELNRALLHYGELDYDELNCTVELNCTQLYCSQLNYDEVNNTLLYYVDLNYYKLNCTVHTAAPG